jgi:8-oxo-dGTP pyrophosphatase MutT (NUDIX family)
MNYQGIVIEESLADVAILAKLHIVSRQVVKVKPEHRTPWLEQWTLHTVSIPDAEAKQVADALSRTLETQHKSWYIDFKDDATHYIIFPGKVFKVDRMQPEQYKPVVAYGLEWGIPRLQLDFSPEIAARRRVREIVAGINPYDDLEAGHKQDILDWIDSGAPLFRVERPDKPPKHLVSYIVPYDEARGRIMLIDHAKAKAWLPPGGHVEVDEDPRAAAAREAKEELDADVMFSTQFGDMPLFVTVTTVKGYGEHTDVSLWYVIEGDSSKDVKYADTDGEGTHQWLTPDEILAMDITKLDMHMHRFIKKLQATKEECKPLVE